MRGASLSDGSSRIGGTKVISTLYGLFVRADAREAIIIIVRLPIYAEGE
jgi:hypothetical protein